MKTSIITWLARLRYRPTLPATYLPTPGNVIFSLLLVAFVLFTQGVWAQETTNAPAVTTATNALPTILPYQLSLQNNAGQPLTGEHNLTFKFFATSTGGSPLFTEVHTNVPFTDGLATLNLGSGSTNGVPADIWADGDVYLEITVNGETLTPREVVPPPTATNLPAGSTLDELQIGSDLHFSREGDRAIINSGDTPVIDIAAGSKGLSPNGGWFRGAWLWLRSLDAEPAYAGSARLHLAKDSSVGNNPFFDIVRIEDDGSSQQVFRVNESGNITTIGTNLLGYGTSQSGVVLRQDGGRALHLVPWGGSGHFWDAVCIGCGSGDADLIVRGSVTQGAIIEKNLQSEAELNAGRIDRFEEGDVLCWDAEADALAHCTTHASPLIVAVADAKGRPIIMGAEPIKVEGRVRAGDLLVSSANSGYAVAWSPVAGDPPTGTVIAKALEAQEDGTSLIKAMIINQ